MFKKKYFKNIWNGFQNNSATFQIIKLKAQKSDGIFYNVEEL